MSDENCCGGCGYPTHATKDRACDWCRKTADQIEALTAENERLRAIVTDQGETLAVRFRRIELLATTNEALTAKLAKAVERLTNMRDDQTGYRHVSHFRRGAAVTLAEIEEAKT